MARKRRLNEDKKNIIASLIEEYDIQTAADVPEAIKDLLGGTSQEMMEAELDNHLGYKSDEHIDNPIIVIVLNRKPYAALYVKYLLLFQWIEAVILNLKLYQNIKRIFQI